MIDLSLMKSFDNFEVASRYVLAYLREVMDFDLWMITRLSSDGKGLIISQVEDHGYNLLEGSSFAWCDSCCARMFERSGPAIAPNINDFPDYKDAPIRDVFAFDSYIGIPITLNSGKLFGTLCAVDPNPQPESIVEHEPLLRLLAALLGSILDADLRVIDQERCIEHIQYQAHTDVLTGLLNRRGWKQASQKEEVRARRYGSAISVFIIDLDNLKIVNDTLGHDAGDNLLCSTTRCLQSILRENDIFARLGGDEFAVLAVGCDSTDAELLLNKIKSALDDHQIEASVGLGQYTLSSTLEDAVRVADLSMYQDKAARREQLQRSVS